MITRQGLSTLCLECSLEFEDSLCAEDEKCEVEKSFKDFKRAYNQERKDLTPAEARSRPTKYLTKCKPRKTFFTFQPEHGQGYIYFVKESDRPRIKIGFSTNFKARLYSLQTHASSELGLVGCLVGTKDDEKALHRRFAGDKLRGEWFYMSMDIEDFIENELKDQDATKLT